jgi:hypothetical protein
MPLALLLPPSRADRRSASELLGPDEPLARALADLECTFEQLGVAVVLACVALFADVWRASILPATAVVLIGLVWRAARLSRERDERILELIIRGEADLPLTSVDRVRHRMADAGLRRRLVAMIALVCSVVSRPVTARRVAGPPVEPRVIELVQRELTQVMDLLGSERPDLRGVARTYRLVAGPCSALYGNDARALREELNQIRFLFEAGP